jgi:hypothetical protein
MWLKLKQFALALLLVNSVASANDISQLDGDWYSFKWKYGYSLSNGKGVAFATNSPNFKVGQEIVRLTAVGKISFVGENVYKDGKFYKVKATLDQDGKLLFEGEKNVKWEMERIDPETYSSIVNSKPENQAKSKPEKREQKNDPKLADTRIASADSNSESKQIGMCLGFIAKEAEARGPALALELYKKYSEDNKKSFSVIVETLKKHRHCFETGVIIADCLETKKVNSKIIELMVGYNTGISKYPDATFRAPMSVACGDRFN